MASKLDKYREELIQLNPSKSCSSLSDYFLEVHSEIFEPERIKNWYKRNNIEKILVQPKGNKAKHGAETTKSGAKVHQASLSPGLSRALHYSMRRAYATA